MQQISFYNYKLLAADSSSDAVAVRLGKGTCNVDTEGHGE